MPFVVCPQVTDMPWEFHAACPDCSHEWDGLTWSERIADGDSRTPTVTYFCTDCCTHLSIATDFDRLSFRNWMRGNLRQVDSCATLKHNVDLISDACKSATGYLFSMDAVWDKLLCVPCNRSLIRDSIDHAGIKCPQCSSRNARSQGCHSHVSVIRVIDDHSKSVRSMTRAEASAEAVRLANELLVKDQDDRWDFTIMRVFPCSFDPRPVGKTPSRWFVGTSCIPRDTPGIVIDGADPMIVVDLVAGTAAWVNESQL